MDKPAGNTLNPFETCDPAAMARHIRMVVSGRREVASHMLNDGTVVAGSSARGKSMLERLSSEEVREWSQWMDQRPGTNGMDWPGWATVEARELKA